jgi:uncharacterized protein DUF4254
MSPEEILSRALADLGDHAAEATRLTRQLHDVNAALWELEDQARATPEDDRLAALKRAIDERNQMRADLVSRIDLTIADALPADAAGAPPLMCSVGGALDRLTVAALRLGALHRAADPRVAAARQQLDDLLEAAATDWTDLQCGRRRLPQPGALKRYGSVPAGEDGSPLETEAAPAGTEGPADGGRGSTIPTLTHFGASI